MNHIQSQMDFLNIFWGDERFKSCYGEFRIITLFEKEAYSYFYKLNEFDERCLEYAMSAHRNLSSSGVANSLYFGVNPRTHESGLATSISRIVALPLDYDSFEIYTKATLKLAELGLKESLRVHSGRGKHLYFLIDQEEDWSNSMVQTVAKMLCQLTGSDPVHDPSRVMRLPGSFNPKADQLCYAEHYNPESQYKISEIAARLGIDPGKDVPPLPVAPILPPDCAVSRCPTEPTELPPPPDKIRRALNGEVVYSTRSESVMAVARWLQQKGLTSDQAKIIMMKSWMHEREADVNRCLEKAYGSLPSECSCLLIYRGHMLTDRGLKVKLEALDGPYRGRSWWQLVDGFVNKFKEQFGVDLQNCLRVQTGHPCRCRVILMTSPSGHRGPRAFFS